MDALWLYMLGAFAIACVLVLVLLRKPGVLLYDWIATRAARSPAVPRQGGRAAAAQPARSGRIASGQALSGQ